MRDSRYMGGLTGSDGRNCPRVLAGMGSRCRGGPGTKDPRGRHPGCVRRSHYELHESPTTAGKLVNQGRHAAHTSLLDQLPETSHPQGPDDPLGRCDTKGPSQGSLQEPPRGRRHRMPSGEADRLAPGHTHGEVRGHRKALPRDRGARGSEVPLLQRNQRGHPARTHLSQSWSASEPAPTTSPRDLPHFEAARNSTASGEPRTSHCGKEPADGYRHQARKSSRRSEPGI